MASQHNQTPMITALKDFVVTSLQDEMDPDELAPIKHYSEDGFLYFEPNNKTEVMDSVLQFYEAIPVSDIYQKIAQIPFHLIISLSPDQLLCQAFEAQNLPFHFHYYSKKQYNKTEDNQKLNFKPSSENRLIYNLFGSIENEDSLILTYDDLFEFLQRFFNNHNLPDTVRIALEEANYFVFVGFNYASWYLKLMLRLMNIHNKVKKKYGMDTPLRPELETFFVNEFAMNFTRMGAVDFINELHQRCAEEDLLVKKEASKPVHFKLKAKQHLEQSEIEAAMNILLDACKNGQWGKDECNTVHLQSAKYQQVKKDFNDGIIK